MLGCVGLCCVVLGCVGLGWVGLDWVRLGAHLGNVLQLAGEVLALRLEFVLEGAGDCQDRIGMGPPRARTRVIYVDLGYRAVSGPPYKEGVYGVRMVVRGSGCSISVHGVVISVKCLVLRAKRFV